MNAPARTPACAAPVADRAADLAVITEHHGGPIPSHVDDVLMRRLFWRFGWDMLTDDALAFLASEYEAIAEAHERRNADNRRIWASQAIEHGCADTALVTASLSCGRDLAADLYGGC